MKQRLLCLVMIAASILAMGAEEAPESKITPSVSTGYSHQFESDIDGDSSMSVDEFSLGGGLEWSSGPQRSIGLKLGYSYLNYDFEGSRGFVAQDTWDEVEIWRIGAPMRWGLDQRWTVSLIPNVTFAAERGADLDHGLTAGGVLVLSYNYSKDLMLGLGVGGSTQIEDDIQVFPFAMINWKATDSLTINLGRGDESAAGPGLSVSYASGESWLWYVGGSYSNRRFRLDDRGPAAEGVGEDTSYRAYAGVRYSFSANAEVRLTGGVAFDGDVELEDKNGHRIAQESYDTAPFAGLKFVYKF